MKTLYSPKRDTERREGKNVNFPNDLQYFTKVCHSCTSVLLVNNPTDLTYTVSIRRGWDLRVGLAITCSECEATNFIEEYPELGNPVSLPEVCSTYSTHKIRDQWDRSIPLAMRTQAYRRWEKSLTVQQIENIFGSVSIFMWSQRQPRVSRKLHARLMQCAYAKEEK